MSHQDHFVSGNASYASTFTQGNLTLPPKARVIIITCMDARIEPLRQLNYDLGNAHVVRNAGGPPKDAIRSIIISQRLLGTREIAVFRHTDCGMLTFTTPELRQKVKDAAPGDQRVAEAVDQIDFLEISNLEQALMDDVQFLKNHPLVLNETTITGWIWDVKEGKAHLKVNA